MDLIPDNFFESELNVIDTSVQRSCFRALAWHRVKKAVILTNTYCWAF